ncbi:MAG: hypothetical protein JXP34_28355 [Planctomycetes bacterium]|nr:hypothetical protein [Planctomycetota bacterium]
MGGRLILAVASMALAASAAPFPEVTGTGSGSEAAVAIERAKREALSSFIERYLSSRALGQARDALESRILAHPDQFLRSHRLSALDRTDDGVRAEVRARVSVGALRGALAEEIEPLSIALVVDGIRGGEPLGTREPGTRLARALLSTRGLARVIDPSEIETLGDADGAELGIRTLADLVCSGRIELALQDTAFEKLFLGRAEATLRIVRSATGEIVDTIEVPFADDRLCRSAEAYARAADGVYAKAGERLRRAVEALARKPKGREVRIETVFEPVYTSCFLSYRNRPLGVVTIANESDRSIEGASVEFSFEGRPALLAEPCQTAIETIPAGGRTRVEIRPKLAAEVLRVRDPEVPATIRVVRDGEEIAASKRALFLYDRNTFSWETPERVAVFIQPQDPAVDALIKGLWPEVASRLGPGGPPRNIAAASVLLSALGGLGLVYRPDPLTPIAELSDRTVKDRVQYPQETLVARSGDCDDLSVLVCTVLEAADIPAAMAVGEAHVLPLLDTGLRASELETAPLDPASVVVWKSRIWIPIEATALGKPGATFPLLWEAARARDGWLRDERTVRVAIRQAWASYQGVSAETDPAATDWIRRAPWAGEAVAARIRDAFEKLRAGFRDALASRVAAVRERGGDPESVLRATGILYARAGLLPDARTAFEASIAARPTFEAHYDLGICLTLSAEKPEDLADAVRHFREAIRLLAPDDLPGRAETLMRLALTQRLRGDREGEAEALALASAIDPSLEAQYAALVATDGTKAAEGMGTDESRAFLREGLR